MRADRDGRDRDQMESIMLTQRHDIRRRLDGSIDIDFYRHKGLMERRAVMTNFFSGAKTLVKPLVAAAVLAGALYTAPMRDGTGWNGPNPSGTRLNSASLATIADFTR
jgi:hypothetical protein